MSDPAQVWVKTELLDSTNGDAASTIRTRSLRSRNEDYDDRTGPVDWGWAWGVVLSNDNARETMEIGIRDEESTWHGRNVTVSMNAWKSESVVMANRVGDQDEYEEDPDQYPDDMITLTHLHEPAVVSCLRERYLMDKIYTNTGSILLALNPFKNCRALYSRQVMQQYWKHGEQSLAVSEDSSSRLPPHVYATADESFRVMMRRLQANEEGRRASGRKSTCDQSILVSGESGAGKTVTTKFIMQYLATLSQRAHPSAAPSSGEPVDHNIEQQVLQSNPILESFGNARTIRNDNSSRFGKFIEIQFSKSGTLVGASVETYLLEKVRLIAQSEGERNYHIFYELFCMADGEKEFYGLDGYQLQDFSLTNQSGTYDRRDGVEDYDTYDELRRAMETMGMSQDEQRDVLAIPCAALHGSNLTLVARSADESALDTENEHLESFLSLMGLTSGSLDRALCYFNIKAGKEVHTRTLPKAKAEKGLEAIIKATYSALFTFLVKRINESITVKNEGGRSRRGGSGKAWQATIAVLDIFGFESFKTNSFEQLCINYCNEALQQQFTRFVLQKEQEEYEREGIEWKFILFPENQDVLDLIDKKGSGILNILDDQCRAPGTTDKTFCIDLYRKCSDHVRFEADYRQVGAQRFGIKHYAGPVEYDTEGFVEKNRDDLPREATDLLLSSKKKIVKQLAVILQNPSPAAPSPSRGTSPGQKRGGSSTSRVTVGGQFSRQLHDLRNRIDTTTPHYIRCLKPNDLLVPDDFNSLIIANQLRYAGVIEAVRVSRVGFPQRFSHATFLNRYKIICSVEMKKAARSPRREKPIAILVQELAIKVQCLTSMDTQQDAFHQERKTEQIDEATSLLSVGIQVGKTKVFLRQGAYDLLEKLRGRRMVDSAIIVQAAGRRYSDRGAYLAMLDSAVVLQCFVRIRLAIRHVVILRKNYRATVIQSLWRRCVAEKHFKGLAHIAIWLQKTQRGRTGRRVFMELDRERKVISIQKYWRCYCHQSRWTRERDATLTVQRAIRCWKARLELKQLRLGARDLQAAVQQRDGLRNENEELRRQLQEALAAASTNESFATTSAAMEAESEVLQLQIDELKAMADTLRRELGESKVREVAADELAAKTILDLKTLRDELRNVRAELVLSQQRLGSSQEEVKTMSDQLINRGKEVETLALHVEKSEQTMAQLGVAIESDRASFLQKLEHMKNEVDGSQEQAAKDLLAIELLTSENERLCSEIEIYRSNAEDASLKLLERQKEASYTISELEEKHHEAETLLAKRDGEIQLLKSELLDAERIAQVEREKHLEESNRLNHELEETKRTSKLLGMERALELEKMSNQLSEARSSAESDRASSAKQLEQLTLQLEQAEKRASDCTPAISPAVEKAEAGIVESAAADEILTLQDEVERLNRELDGAHLGRATGNASHPYTNDDDSRRALMDRYEELRRLADAGIEKDREIERLRQQLEQVIEDQSQASDPEDDELERLRNEIINLREQLGSHRSSKNNKQKSFFGRMFEADDPSISPESDLGKEVVALKSVNELLRTEVEQSRKSIQKLEEDLQDERNRAQKELESFANSLQAVDELRQAAESMSRELHRKPMNAPDAAVSESPDGCEALEDATRILERAKSNFQKLSKDDKVKKRKKKKRRGSDNASIVSSFF